MLKPITIKPNSAILSIISKLIDLALYLSVALIAFYQHFSTLRLPSFYLLSLLIACLLFIPVFSFFGVYESRRGKSFWNYLQMLLPAFIALMMLLGAVAFLTKTGSYYSRSWFLWWHFNAFLALVIFRLILQEILKVLRKKGLNHKRVVIIGYNNLIPDLVKRVKEELWVGFDIVAVLVSEVEGKIKKISIPIHKLPQDLSNYVEKQQIDEVWVVAQNIELDKIVSTLQRNIVAVRYFPAFSGFGLLNHSVSEVMGFPVINIISSPMSGINRMVKAIEDRLLAALILLLTSPLLLIIAILVKVSSPGPILFRQQRIGWNGKEFAILKFRTMPINAEANTGAIWATAEDKRATKIGAFLRKTSLDELPQFINVLKGEMSIVGPRPERPQFVKEFKEKIPNYMQKHLVKAGITGWAQVNGWRGNTSLEKRIEYDLYYINHWSLWFDLKIIFLTIFKGFVNKNAY